MIPAAARLAITHATVQFVADDDGARILHIKGPALDERLLHLADGQPIPRSSTDVDVLVEPSYARPLVRRLLRHGWRRVAGFATGSPFEHAATVWHDRLGYADIHRFFPGIELPAAVAFDKLWHARHGIELGRRLCWVPSLDHQRLLLLLHAARTSGPAHPDLRPAWILADHHARARTRVLAAEFGAQLPLAAALGELDHFRGDRRHQLWEQFSSGTPHPRSSEWWARIKAARSPLDAAQLAVRALSVNADHLTMELGRRPTRKEFRGAWLDRFRRAVDENVHTEEPR